MREILFRGKRLRDGQWVVGNLFIPDLVDAPTEISFREGGERKCLKK